MAASVDNSLLIRWRGTDAAETLQKLAEWAKRDVSFCERTAKGTSRWHVCVNGNEYELLCSGPKFFDTRQQTGGGGAVDLTMHLFGMTFKQATRALRERGL
jgi:hypothetical protein